MSDFSRNLVVLTGNLVSEVKEFQTDKVSGVRATLAVQRTDKQADFIFFAAFGSEAKKLIGFPKGTSVTIVGKLTTHTTEKDGKKRTFMNVVADRVSVFDKQVKQRKAETAQYEEASDEIPF